MVTRMWLATLWYVGGGWQRFARYIWGGEERPAAPPLTGLYCDPATLTNCNIGTHPLKPKFAVTASTYHRSVFGWSRCRPVSGRHHRGHHLGGQSSGDWRSTGNREPMWRMNGVNKREDLAQH